MYLDFFGLHERPFTITPDPRYLYMSERHAEALAHLIYGITESDGFIVLTGEVGTGKTTLVRSLLQKMPAEADVALILNPELSAVEFLTAIISELGITPPAETSRCLALTETLNRYLLDAHSRGRRTIAVVDEAQNLSAEVLEQIRMLTNLETTRNKLLQIVLIGQPELRDVLARSDLRQLAQRVTARYHLLPLNAEEASQYLDHRLAVAGAVRPILNIKTKKRIYQLAGGIPRLMNLIADRVLLGAWSREQREIDGDLIDAAAGEVFGRAPMRVASKLSWPAVLAGIMAIALVGTTIALVASERRQSPIAATPIVRPIERQAQADAPALADSVQTLTLSTNDLDAWLKEHRNRTGNRHAFTALFDRWRIVFEPDDVSACEQARKGALRCVADRGSLAGLLSLDRPAIMTLHDFDGEPHQVLLAAADQTTLTLSTDQQSITVPRGALEPLWFGEYLLLWKPPNNEVRSLRPGMRARGVLWLRQSLTAIQGAQILPADSDLYDEPLQARVRDYQRSRRLTVDGLVGQQTQMMINADLGLSGVPNLDDDDRPSFSTIASEIR